MRRKSSLTRLTLAGIFFLFNLVVNAADINEKTLWSAYFASDNRIAGLEWKSRSLEIQNDPTSNHDLDSPEKGNLVLKGNYLKRGWRLFHNEHEIRVSSEGSFQISFPIPKNSAQISLTARGPNETQTEMMDIRPESPIAPTRVTEEAPEELFGIYAGLGFSTINFSQGALGNLDETSLLVAAGFYQALIPNLLDVNVRVQFTGLPLTSSLSAVTARFLDAAATVGYHFSALIEAPWDLSLWGGLYYSSMLVTNDILGYKNLFAPELFPRLKRNFNSGNSAAAFVRIIPLSNGVFNLSFSDREISGGVSYEHKFPTTRSVRVDLEMINLKITLNSNSPINSTRFLLTGSYVF